MAFFCLVFLQIHQLSLPLAARLDVPTLHLQTLNVPTSSLVGKSVRPPPAVGTSELSLSSHFLLSASVVLHAPLAVDTPTASRLVRMEGHQRANLTDEFVWWLFDKIAVVPPGIYGAVIERGQLDDVGVTGHSL